MRLFLSSYRAGKHTGRLKEFAGDAREVAIITNAKDYKKPEDRDIKIEDNFNFWEDLGIKPIEVDLRSYFHKSGAEKLLANHKFIWLAGGNVFLLRRALNYTGLDKFLCDKVAKNELVLGGESAGAIIMGPTLHYSEMETEDHEDSPFVVPDGYQKDVIWEGLRLINYVPVPHYKTEDYGVEIDKYIALLDKNSIPHKEMTDDQAIIINGKREEFLK